MGGFASVGAVKGEVRWPARPVEHVGCGRGLKCLAQPSVERPGQQGPRPWSLPCGSGPRDGPQRKTLLLPVAEGCLLSRDGQRPRAAGEETSGKKGDTVLAFRENAPLHKGNVPN